MVDKAPDWRPKRTQAHREAIESVHGLTVTRRDRGGAHPRSDRYRRGMIDRMAQVDRLVGATWVFAVVVLVAEHF